MILEELKTAAEGVIARISQESYALHEIRYAREKLGNIAEAEFILKLIACAEALKKRARADISTLECPQPWRRGERDCPSCELLVREAKEASYLALAQLEEEP